MLRQGGGAENDREGEGAVGTPVSPTKHGSQSGLDFSDFRWESVGGIKRSGSTSFLLDGPLNVTI